MPLSEHEERILAEIERQLSEEDPRFVQRARRTASRDRRAVRVRAAAIGFGVGFLTLLGITFHLLFGLAGFALMFASVVVGVGALAGDDADDPVTERLKRIFRGRDHAG